MNEIAEGLYEDGQVFSDKNIFKVLCSKEVIEKSKRDNTRLIQFVSIEATPNVFKEEPVLTIYCRDMTEYVRAIKSELKHDKKRMKGQYEQKIEDALVDLKKKGSELP